MRLIGLIRLIRNESEKDIYDYCGGGGDGGVYLTPPLSWRRGRNTPPAFGHPLKRGNNQRAAEAVEDGLGMDTMEEYNERMMRWRVLHGGMSRRESDK